MQVLELSELQQDALREIANIGACHAATALSHLVQKKIIIDVPRISVVPFPDFTNIFDGPETMVVGMYTPIFGDLAGSILFMLPRDDALQVVDLLWGQPIGRTKTLKERDREILRQTSNILVASYLSAMAKFVGLTSLASSSAVSFDMLGAIIDAMVIDIHQKVEEAILVETELVVAKSSVKGLMFFVPDHQSIEKILRKIKAK